MLELLRATPTQAFVGRVRRALEQDTLALLHPQASDAEEAALRYAMSTLTLAPSTMTLLSTSGSTGAPKRVELSRAAWLAHANAANRHLDLRADDRWLVTLPLSHTGGLSILLRCHVAGAEVVVGDVPRLGAPFAAWIAAHSVTRLSLVPAQLACLLDAHVAPRGLRSVLLGGQAAPPALLARACSQGWPIVTSYGMTETCGMCVASTIGAPPSDAVGQALPGTELRLRETLELRSVAQATAVHGAAAFSPDGWLRTNDLATIRESGVTILGRSDDVIIASGHKIDPLEVEAAIAALPEVAAVAVVGVAHATHGATVAALIVLRRGATLDLDRTALAPYKRPRHVVYVDALPLLPTGKLDRAEARRLLA